MRCAGIPAYDVQRAKVLGVYKKVYFVNGGCHATSSPLFRWKMCHLEKHKKTLNIFDTIQPIFIKFSSNDHTVLTVAGHLILVTDYLGNVGQDQNLQKF